MKCSVGMMQEWSNVIDARVTGQKYVPVLIPSSTLPPFRWGRRIGLEMGSLYLVWTQLSTRVAARPAVQRVFKHEGIDID
jgi:hypothetical protein